MLYLSATEQCDYYKFGTLGYAKRCSFKYLYVELIDMAIREEYFNNYFRFKFYTNALRMPSNRNYVISHDPYLMFL